MPAFGDEVVGSMTAASIESKKSAALTIGNGFRTDDAGG
jgi:hypothetical protein